MSAGFALRAIDPRDDAAIASIIRTAMPEFGAGGAGFAIHDAEVAAMHAAYTQPRCAYVVVEVAGQVLGGGGIAPLAGAAAATCELRKMYFLPSLRGRGAGHALLEHCLAAAVALGYRRCYIETLTGMDAARHLYAAHGFRPIPAALGATGHFGCDRYYLRDL